MRPHNPQAACTRYVSGTQLSQILIVTLIMSRACVPYIHDIHEAQLTKPQAGMRLTTFKQPIANNPRYVAV